MFEISDTRHVQPFVALFVRALPLARRWRMEGSPSRSLPPFFGSPPLVAEVEAGHPGHPETPLPPGAVRTAPGPHSVRSDARPSGSAAEEPAALPAGPGCARERQSAAEFLCLACWRPSQDLCAFPHPRTSVLLEVCRGCYVLEETRRLASRLQENTEFYRLFVARATALYL